MHQLAAAPTPATPVTADTRDKWERFADHVFLNFLFRTGGCSKAVLLVLLQIKRRVTEQYRLIGTEEHVEAKEFLDALTRAWLQELNQPVQTSA